ncbi:glycerophosphodiester phosphodiesterase [soil metagenome]
MKLPALITLLTLMLTGLALADPAPAPVIVAHRGASADAPENSLAAFREAWKQGADAIEGDFHLTVDGHIVCFHDFDTKKMAGTKHVVAESTAESLRALEIPGGPMPSFADVVATVPEDGTFYIEIKCGPEILDTLFDKLDATTLRPDQIVIISFNQDVIAAVKERRPQYVANWLRSLKSHKVTRQITPSLDSLLPVLKEIGADGLSTSAHGKVDAQWVERLRAEGFDYHVWTVDDPAEARRFAELGASSITTNRPAAIREALNE